MSEQSTTKTLEQGKRRCELHDTEPFHQVKNTGLNVGHLCTPAIQCNSHFPLPRRGDQMLLGYSVWMTDDPTHPKRKRQVEVQGGGGVLTRISPWAIKQSRRRGGDRGKGNEERGQEEHRPEYVSVKQQKGNNESRDGLKPSEKQSRRMRTVRLQLCIWGCGGGLCVFF